MKTLSAHQPAFMPWPGYFDRIRRSDVFALLVGVQFEKGSFINRNRIKTQDGVQYLTVPIKSKRPYTKLGKQGIQEVEISDTVPWQKKHLKTIQHAYCKAPRFEENWPKLQALYESFSGKYLLDVCMQGLIFWLQEYDLSYAKIHHVNDKKVRTEELIDFCDKSGCDTYLSGPLGRNYLDEDKFLAAWLNLEYHDYKCPIYAQLHGEFVPNLSILDMWMNSEGNP